MKRMTLGKAANAVAMLVGPVLTTSALADGVGNFGPGGSGMMGGWGGGG